jgi:hypothetical protein
MAVDSERHFHLEQDQNLLDSERHFHLQKDQSNDMDMATAPTETPALTKKRVNDNATMGHLTALATTATRALPPNGHLTGLTHTDGTIRTEEQPEMLKGFPGLSLAGWITPSTLDLKDLETVQVVSASNRTAHAV